MIALLAMAFALAQDPPPAVPPGDVQVQKNDEGVNEIVVYGDAMVDKARRQLIYDLQQMGYTDVEDKGDYVRLRNEDVWKGEIRLYDDGWIKMKRQPVHVKSPDLGFAESGSPISWASCLLFPPMCLKTSGQTLGRRKWLGVEHETLSGIQVDAQNLGDRVADAATDGRINDLPAKLEALWAEGVPLVPDEAPIPTMEGRKAAILAFWDSRTDTIWGDRVRVAVEAFVRAEVQTTPWGFSAEEVAAFNRGRHCQRVLDLERPWDDVLAEIEP